MPWRRKRQMPGMLDGYDDPVHASCQKAGSVDILNSTPTVLVISGLPEGFKKIPVS